jgi:SAM-dependent methyltransferase
LGVSEAAIPDSNDESHWFKSHYESAAHEVIDFLASDGFDMAGRQIADVGCGDGIMDLGLIHKARPAHLTGFDIASTDVEYLLAEARRSGVAQELPPNLEFVTSGVRDIPADDEVFDFVVSWSTFEHVEDPTALASEIRRVLRRDGVLFLQLWPFYYSAHGAHLWTWFPDGWEHLREPSDLLETRIAANSGRASPTWTRARIDDLRTLNRLTVDGLEQALHDAGLRVAKAELLGGSMHPPPDIDDVRLVDLAIEGIKLIAARTD